MIFQFWIVNSRAHSHPCPSVFVIILDTGSHQGWYLSFGLGGNIYFFLLSPISTPLTVACSQCTLALCLQLFVYNNLITWPLFVYSRSSKENNANAANCKHSHCAEVSIVCLHFLSAVCLQFCNLNLYFLQARL